MTPPPDRKVELIPAGTVVVIEATGAAPLGTTVIRLEKVSPEKMTLVLRLDAAIELLIPPAPLDLEGPERDEPAP